MQLVFKWCGKFRPRGLYQLQYKSLTIPYTIPDTVLVIIKLLYYPRTYIHSRICATPIVLIYLTLCYIRATSVAQ